MRSPAQIEASRRNGARSRGPVTAEGKARSSQNAITHGLSSRKLLLPQGESHGEVLELQQQFADRFLPANPEESTLLNEMALALWQNRRCLHLETALLEAPTPFRTHRRELGYLIRHQAHIDRIFEHHLQTLLRLRNKNCKTNPSPATE